MAVINCPQGYTLDPFGNCTMIACNSATGEGCQNYNQNRNQNYNQNQTETGGLTSQGLSILYIIGGLAVIFLIIASTL